jgi:hypothetical protein
MMIQGHMAYPFLIVHLISAIFHIPIAAKEYTVLILFSIIPDMDTLIRAIIPWKKKHGEKWFNKQHHKWASHWPATYLFLFVIYAFNSSTTVLMMIIGLYSHFILDSFVSGDGIMWLFPFSRKFFNFFASKTSGYSGIDWAKRYAKTTMFKIDNVCFLATVLIILFRI